jgi:uncharacterized cupredoxin-like copper-binding protein
MNPRTRLSRFAKPFVVISSAALLLIGCTNDGESPSAADGAGTTVNVTLQEWAVLPDPGSVPAGEVTFSITNDGPEDVHEFVVIATDLDAGELPTDETGAVDEAGEGIEEVVGEIEEIAVGATEELTVSLDAGTYALLCNIYSEEEAEAHYAMGMHTAFSVTD